jgi:hypothetical protein
MSKRAYLPLICCLLLASTVLGEQKRIKLKSGRIIIGEVVERTESGVKVQGTLAVVFYPNDQIEAIEDILSPQADYEKRLAQINQKDPEAHVALGRWALENKLYEEAVERFKAALALKKDHEMASLLLRQATAKLKEATGGDGEAATIEPIVSTRTPFDAKVLLKTDDIYRIRLEEMRDDERIGVTFRNDAIDRFVRQMQGKGDFQKKGFDRTFRGWPAGTQAQYIRKNADRDDPIRDDVEVRADPAFMREFRGGIWRWISGSCASVSCHGSKEGKGSLKLFSFPGRNAHVDYTNFLILDSYCTKSGERMISRDQHERSLLLQYALPPDQAQQQHPKKVRPTFNTRNAGGYKMTLEWIKKLAGPIHPSYRIKDLPPNVMKPAGLPGLQLPAPTTQPATTRKVDTPF